MFSRRDASTTCREVTSRRSSIASSRFGTSRLSLTTAITEALQIYASSKLDFGDAMIAASMRLDGLATLYSYDRDFDRLADVTRLEP